jgi:subtilase family serine protease
MHRGKYRLTAGWAAIAVAAGALAAVAIPASAAATASVALAGSAATPLPAGAVRLGALAPATSLTIDVTLKLGNEPALDALVAGLANPKSPYFGRFVGKDQFGPEFGLSASAIARVTSTLAGLGLHPGAVDPDRLYIPVTGTAAAVEHAFGVTLASYRLPGGRVAYANSAAPKVPASIAPVIDGVLGLDTVYQPRPLDHQLAARATPKLSGPMAALAASTASPAVGAAHGPAPCASATDNAIAMHGFTANQLASHYLMTSLYKVDDTGLGLSVAVAELEPHLAADIKGFEQCYGITTKVVNTTVGKSVGTGAGSGEAVLDIENIASIAPGVTIDDYQDGKAGLTPLYDIAAKVAALDRDQVLSISYGLCDAESGTALLSAYQTVFKALTVKGIGTVAASGDSGSTGCFVGSSKSAALNPVAPASSANVFSVGGTTMTSAGVLSNEVAWNGSGTPNPGASGGGVSTVLCMPSYQSELATLITGLISPNSVTAASCKSGTNPSGYRRQVPDISANASGSSPYVMFYRNKWAGFYGTSAATSLVAAEAALIDASPFCSALGWNAGPHVMLPQALYLQVAVDNALVYLDQPPTLLHDITKGNNDDTASGYTGGLYPATKGYDEATGLGTPLLTDRTLPYFFPGMASDMCHFYARGGLGKVSTHSVSPSTVKAGRATVATVTGTGFVSIPFANAAMIMTIGKRSTTVAEVWATCASHTSCKIKLPKLKAGKYHVEMLVADYLPCRDGCKGFVTLTVH